METKGIEPSFPRCDRGVLPLHHVPIWECADLDMKLLIISFFVFITTNPGSKPRDSLDNFIHRLKSV